MDRAFPVRLNWKLQNTADQTVKRSSHTVAIFSCDSAWVSVSNAKPHGDSAETHLRHETAYVGFWSTSCSTKVLEYTNWPGLKLYKRKRQFYPKGALTPLSKPSRKMSLMIHSAFFWVKNKNGFGVRNFFAVTVSACGTESTFSSIVHVLYIVKFSIPHEVQTLNSLSLLLSLVPAVWFCYKCFYMNISFYIHTIFWHHIFAVIVSKGRTKKLHANLFRITFERF